MNGETATTSSPSAAAPATAPAARLAVFRVLTGAFVVGYLLVRLPVFLAMGDRDAAGFDPVGVLWWMGEPLRPGFVDALVALTVVLGAGYAAGLAFRVTGPAFAVALLVLTTYRSSGGQLIWFEHLMVLHVLVVAWSPAADALTVGRRRAGESPPADDVRYWFPLRLAAIVTVLTYALAGVAKLRIGGFGWLDGASLRNHVAYSAARLRVLGGTPSPLARPLVDHPWVFTPAAFVTVAVELGAPVVLWLRMRWVATWVGIVWAMHVAIAATMFVVFPYPLALVAFAPLFPLEHLPLLRRWTGPRSQT